LFIAGIRLIWGEAINNIVIAQSVIFALGACYALWVAFLWLNRSPWVLLPGVVIAMSPLTIAWASWILTETLAAATALWVFAEIFQSLRKGTLQLVPISGALIAATLIRWDQVLLVPVLVCAVYIHGISIAIEKLGKIAFLVMIPFVIMIARAHYAGLPLIPRNLDTQMDPWLPRGVVDFYKLTSLNQNANAHFLWPIWSRQYDVVPRRINYEAFAESVRDHNLHSLIEKIGAIPNGQEFPDALDQKFSRLNRDYEQNNAPSIYLLNPVIRAIHMWTSRDEIYFSGWTGTQSARNIEFISRYYKILLLLSAIGLVVFLCKQASPFALVLSTLLYVVARTVFLVSIPISAIENRYLTPFFPVLELVVITMVIAQLKAQNIGLHGAK